MKAFWLELKCICKGFSFLAVIFVLIAVQVMLFTQFQNESVIATNRLTRANDLYSAEMQGWNRFWERRNADPDRYHFPNHIIQANYDWYRYENNVAGRILESFNTKDWATYNRYMAEKFLLEWQIHMIFQSFTHRHPNLARLPTPEQYFGDDWNRYRVMIEYPEFDRLPLYINEREFQLPEQSLYSAVYYLHLFQEDVAPMGPHSTSPWGFTFNFLRRGLPNILGILVLIMTVNLVHRDKKSGSIKSILQLPKSRTFYLLRKVSLGFTSSLIVVLIPQFFMFLVLGIKRGFSGANFPVLIDNGFFNWAITPDPVAYKLRFFTPVYRFGLSQYQLTVPYDYTTLGRLDIIALWQFLSLAFIMVAIFILLYAVLGVLISILVKNEIFAQIIAVGTFVLGTSFGSIFPRLSTSLWDVFAKINVISLLEGNHYSTYLSSLVVICGAIVVLFIVSAAVFKKQDIFCD